MNHDEGSATCAHCSLEDTSGNNEFELASRWQHAALPLDVGLVEGCAALAAERVVALSSKDAKVLQVLGARCFEWVQSGALDALPAITGRPREDHDNALLYSELKIAWQDPDVRSVGGSSALSPSVQAALARTILRLAVGQYADSDLAVDLDLDLHSGSGPGSGSDSLEDMAAAAAAAGVPSVPWVDPGPTRFDLLLPPLRPDLATIVARLELGKARGNSSDEDESARGGVL